jgi:hypothetical protein
MVGRGGEGVDGVGGLVCGKWKVKGLGFRIR